MKKGFKVGADKFISALDESSTQEPQGTHRKYNKPEAPKPYRINLKLNAGHREYLEAEAWKAKKSVTQFINDLIIEHKAKNNELSEDRTFH